MAGNGNFEDEGFGAWKQTGKPHEKNGASSTEEWDELVQNLIDLGITVSGEVSKGLKIGAQQLQKAQKELNKTRKAQARQAVNQTEQATAQTIQKANTMAQRVSNSAKNFSAMLVGGFSLFLAVLAGLVTLVSAVGLAVQWYDAGLTATVIIFGIFTLMFGTVGAWLIRGCGIRNRLMQYRQALEGQASVSVQELSRKVCKSIKFVRKELTRQIEKGMLSVAYLSPDGERLYASEQEYRKQEQKCTQDSQQTQTEDTTMEQVQQFSITLQQHIESTRNDFQIHEELYVMNGQLSDLLDLLESHPQWVPKLRKFARYYMPTILKLLDSYDDVKNQQGEAANQIRLEIAGILHTMNIAFANLRDEMLKDTVLDISTEISAMHTMLAQDGFSVHDNLDIKEQQE